MTSLDSRHANSLWCSVLVETLVRAGLRQAVTSPGSRSTPVTMALIRHRAVETLPAIDERSAAFFALGLARRSHRPIVLVCTSGSAAAHYLPALIEASETRTPLIVITADRPPEMRDCTSGQTIDQNRLFGVHASWYHELALPELTISSMRYLRQTIRQAWNRAAHSGPVHLNAPFRDPLPPVADQGEAERFAAQLDPAFFELMNEPERATRGIKIRQRVTTSRGLIVAGPASPRDASAYASVVLDLSRQSGWPILADALSPVRHHATARDQVVAAYDIILRNEKMASELVPRYVLALESWPTSKTLRHWLENSQAEMLMVAAHSGSRDALHGKTREISAEPTDLIIEGRPVPEPDFAAAWNRAESQVQTALASWMQSTAAPTFEGRVAWTLARQLPPQSQLVVAGSMPVRDLEYFAPVNDQRYQVFASRGANGIDGTLSTALGVAHGADQPTFLLIGDLAFVHDSNGLLLARELRGSLTVVVVNNAGGGIFEHLPIAQFQPEFERYFATPPAVDLARLCAAHHVPHTLLPRIDDLGQWLATPAAGVRVLEIGAERASDAATRRHLFRELAATIH